jgi:predicted dehydrogenase
MKTDQKIYGIGIVGCGNISDTHAEAIKETTNGRLVAAHSRTESTLVTFCNRHDIVAFTSYEAFLENPDLDIVVICTPTGTHLDYGLSAAEAGKHVIVEKPVEITVERGYSLVQACKKNNVKLAVIYQNRFIDDVVRMKKSVERKDIGDIVMASASVKWFRDQAYYRDSSWRGTFKLDGGGVVINQSIHTIDLLQWMVGKVDSIYAFKGRYTHEDMEAEDNAVACLRFKNGVIGMFEASTSIVPAQKRKIEVNGSQGTAYLEGDTFYKQSGDNNEADKNKSTKDAVGADSPLAGMTAQNHQKQYEQILDAFQNNTEPVVSGEESLQSLAVVEGLYQSADRKEPVQIGEILSRAKGK